MLCSKDIAVGIQCRLETELQTKPVSFQDCPPSPTGNKPFHALVL